MVFFINYELIHKFLIFYIIDNAYLILYIIFLNILIIIEPIKNMDTLYHYFYFEYQIRIVILIVYGKNILYTFVLKLVKIFKKTL